MNQKIFLTFLLLVVSCDNSQGPDLPQPTRVQWVPRSGDLAATEMGIDAIPESDGIKLQWFSLHDQNLKKYSIYRRKNQESYFKVIKTIDLETAFPGQDTIYVDDDPDMEFYRYTYYYVTGTNRDDLEGFPSDTVRYQLLEKPQTYVPNGESITALPVFYWSFPQTATPDSFILRIEQEYLNRLHYIAKFQSNYDSPDQTLDLSQVANPPIFDSGFSYRWRIDSIGPDSSSSGAESAWKIFYKN
jgi:hypothetical protein